MKRIDQIFNLTAKSVSNEAYEGDPITTKETPQIVRVDKKELEQEYLSNSIAFNAINKTVQIIMSADYRIKGDEDDVSIVNDFLDSVGDKGGESEWDFLLRQIFKHQMIYGCAWNENIHNTKGDKLIDLDLIDPKRMDYAKDENNNIVLDNIGNPIGYVQSVSWGSVFPKKFNPPQNISVDENQLFIPSDYVTHYKLYTIGDSFYGIGLLEPSHSIAKYRMNIEKGFASSVQRVANPKLKIKIGDPMHEPTTDQVRKSMEQLKNANLKSVIGTPYWSDVSILEPTHIAQMTEPLKYYMDVEVSSYMVPKAFALGSGESTNRATLSRQEYMLKLGLKEVIAQTTRTIEKNIFGLMKKYGQIDSIPKIEWGEIVLEELDSKSKRLIGYAKAGLITPDKKLESELRDLEGLPEFEETTGESNGDE